MTQQERHDAVQRGIFAAFGCVKLDYRSPKRLDEAASVVADFVCAELDRAGGQTLDGLVAQIAPENRHNET